MTGKPQRLNPFTVSLLVTRNSPKTSHESGAHGTTQRTEHQGVSGSRDRFIHTTFVSRFYQLCRHPGSSLSTKTSRSFFAMNAVSRRQKFNNATPLDQTQMRINFRYETAHR